MAKTNSTETFTAEIIGDLDVISSFNELMLNSVAKDSVYIRAKESLQAFFDNSNMKDPDKAAVLSNMLTSMTTSITGQAMTTALAIAKENRDGKYTVSKLVADTLVAKEQADKLAADNAVATATASKIAQDTTNSVIQGWKLQSDMVRDNGITAFPSLTSAALPVANIGDKGLKWEQEQQTKMSVYATLAKSYRESGVVTWTINPTTNKVSSVTDLYPSAPGLTKAQTDVAIRQKKGFDDNMRQHAANSSANMIGLLLSAEESGAINASDVAQWRTAVGYLNSGGSTSGEPSGIIETTNFTSGGNITKASGITLNGTSVNFTLGTIISIKLTTGTGATLKVSDVVSNVINANGSWTLAVAPSHISNLLTGAATISIYAVDQNGAIIYDKDVVSATLV